MFIGSGYTTGVVNGSSSTLSVENIISSQVRWKIRWIWMADGRWWLHYMTVCIDGCSSANADGANVVTLCLNKQIKKPIYPIVSFSPCCDSSLVRYGPGNKLDVTEETDLGTAGELNAAGILQCLHWRVIHQQVKTVILSLSLMAWWVLALLVQLHLGSVGWDWGQGEVRLLIFFHAPDGAVRGGGGLGHGFWSGSYFAFGCSQGRILNFCLKVTSTVGIVPVVAAPITKDYPICVTRCWINNSQVFINFSVNSWVYRNRILLTVKQLWPFSVFLSNKCLWYEMPRKANKSQRITNEKVLIINQNIVSLQSSTRSTVCFMEGTFIWKGVTWTCSRSPRREFEIFTTIRRLVILVSVSSAWYCSTTLGTWSDLS